MKILEVSTPLSSTHTGSTSPSVVPTWSMDWEGTPVVIKSFPTLTWRQVLVLRGYVRNNKECRLSRTYSRSATGAVSLHVPPPGLTIDACYDEWPPNLSQGSPNSTAVSFVSGARSGRPPGDRSPHVL